MQASDRVVARRYAEALFLSAKERGLEEKTRHDLGEAHKALAPQMAALNSPTTAAKEKKAFVARHAQGLGSLTGHFLELLIDKKRTALLGLIVADLGRILDENAGRARAQVRSAAVLSAAELEALVQRLGRLSGKDVVVDAKVDPDLLGGVVVRMGDVVLDGSLQGRLRQMKSKLAEE